MRLEIAVFLLFLLADSAYSAGIVARQQEIKRQLLQQKKQEQQILRREKNIKKQRQDVFRRAQVPTMRRNVQEEIVDIEEIWLEMETSSQIWKRIIDYRPKEATVEMYINWYKKHQIYIRKPAAEYVKIIDNMVVQNPDILSNPFRDILKVAAIIEYDFDNGQNKDIMAKKILGREAYLKNKRRLGL